MTITVRDRSNALVVCAVVAACMCSPLASANSVTFVTPVDATVSAGPVSASATFVTLTNSLQLTLRDLLVNPGSAGQLVSDISFSAAGLTSGTGTANVPSATYIDVASNGTTSAGACCANWQLTSSGGVYHLNGIGGNPYSGPDYLIIGPPAAGGTYSNANRSIAGNDPHNPFIYESAVFTLGLTGMTSSTLISNVVFSFGTQAGSNVAGVPAGPDVPVVPIPAAAWLFGSGLIALVGMARRSRPATKTNQLSAT